MAQYPLYKLGTPKDRKQQKNFFLLHEPALVEIGKKYGKTPRQVVIAWHMSRDLIVSTKADFPDNIAQNIQAVLRSLDAVSDPKRTVLTI